MKPKHLYFTSFWFISNLVFCQNNISGNYSTSTGYDRIFLNLNNDKSFVFIKSGCFGNTEGRGNYELKKDSLILKINMPKKEYSFYSEIEKKKSKSDSVSIEIKTFEPSGLELVFIKVSLYNSINADNNSLISSKSTNFEGTANFKLKKKNQPIWLKCECDSDKTELLKIDLIENYKIKAQLVCNGYKIIENETLTFKIKEQASDMLHLINADNEFRLKKIK